MRPHPAHLDVASEAARELRCSSSFGAIVGARVVAREDLADAVDVAAAWEQEVRATEAWLAHARAQSCIAWDGLFATLNRVRPVVLAIQEQEPSLSQELPAFTRLLTARFEVGKRAASTLRKRAAQAGE